ncbi:MAG: hypothetical protein JNL79_17250 [Myxococcales bacterium]|nr:hypothetical protein [Myxococcales bacterium]
MRAAWGAVVLTGCLGLPDGECQNPNQYRVLALDQGRVYEHRAARVYCTTWNAGCAATDPKADPYTSPKCECRQYRLSASDFMVDFPPAKVGDEVTTSGGGKLRITKRVVVPTACDYGDYYVDYSGTLEGKIGGHVFARGVFYALGKDKP